MRVAVITISDTVAKGEREDASGPAVVASCRGLGWEVTTSLRLPDDPLSHRQGYGGQPQMGRTGVSRDRARCDPTDDGGQRHEGEKDPECHLGGKTQDPALGGSSDQRQQEVECASRLDGSRIQDVAEVAEAIHRAGALPPVLGGSRRL